MGTQRPQETHLAQDHSSHLSLTKISDDRDLQGVIRIFGRSTHSYFYRAGAAMPLCRHAVPCGAVRAFEGAN